MASVKIKDVDIYYEIHGTGEPLVLIAGLATDSQSWLPIIDDLAKKYQVVVFDNRGVGRTKPMDAKTSIRQMADDCIGLIKSLGFSSVNLLGHSMGGMIALDCAIRYPEYFSKLIVASSSAVNTQRNTILFDDWITYLNDEMKPELWFRNLFYWIFSKRFFEDEETLKTAIQMSIDYPYPQSRLAYKNQVNAIKEFNCCEKLSGIKPKTLIVNGEEDILFSPDESYSILKTIPGAKFSFIEGVAHSIHMEKPVEFVKVIEDFLKNI